MVYGETVKRFHPHIRNDFIKLGRLLTGYIVKKLSRV